MSAVKLFISYRRADSEHAAQRVRERLQARFGDEAVFIDREMPPGVDWSETLARNVEQSTGLVVMIGERFVELLKQDAASGEPDPMLAEIVAAIQAGKRLYPVVTGLRDMPTPQDLPPELHPLLQQNAVFAPAPYFDAAMDALIKAIAAQHAWVDPVPVARSAGAASTAAPTTLPGMIASGAGTPFVLTLWSRWLLTALVAVGIMAFCGRLLAWLAQAPEQAQAEAAVWQGGRYVLATLFLGLGPFLARWLVSELRARSWLPVNNFMGLITSVNMAGMLLCGALFLLLSTIPGWRLWPLLPLSVFPADPGPWHYVMLSLLLLCLVIAAVALAIYEPSARRQRQQGHMLSLHALHALALLLLLAVGWFAASLITSLPQVAGIPLVPLVGYVMLCPVLSLLFAVWELAPTRLGNGQLMWPFRTLLAMLVSLYLMVTLALFAYGPLRIFIAPV